MQIDLSPIVTPLITLAGIALTTAVTWALGRAASYFHVSTQNVAIQAFDEALTRSIHAGAGTVADTIRSRGYDHPEVQSAVVAWAAPYAIAKFSPALKRIGLDTNDPKATIDYITDELNRIFPTAMTEFGASPTTPPTLPVFSPGSINTKELNERSTSLSR